MKPFRFASLVERQFFYEHDFNLTGPQEWLIHRFEKTAFAVQLGEDTKIVKPEYADRISEIIIFKPKSMNDLKQRLQKYLPEDVYYDRNLYADFPKCEACRRAFKNCFRCRYWLGQEIVFDIDPENIPCPNCGTLEDRMRKGQRLLFCNYCMKLSFEEGDKLYHELREKYLFKNIKVVYSGRGLHLYILDKETLKMKKIEREKLAWEIKNEGYHIDYWVTTGSSRLIRLPWSLHGYVSRIVLPISPEEILNFDPTTDQRCMPSFL